MLVLFLSSSCNSLACTDQYNLVPSISLVPLVARVSTAVSRHMPSRSPLSDDSKEHAVVMAVMTAKKITGKQYFVFMLCLLFYYFINPLFTIVNWKP